MAYGESYTDQVTRFQILRLMNNHTMTQEKLGHILSLTASMANRKCRGRSPFKLAELGAIALHFGCDVAALVTQAAPLPGDKPRRMVMADGTPAGMYGDGRQPA